MQTLLEMNERYETAQKGQYVVENVTSQLRKMVAERERRRGRPFSDTESVGTQSLASLLHHVERHNTEVETENEQSRLHLRQVRHTCICHHSLKFILKLKFHIPVWVCKCSMWYLYLLSVRKCD